MLHFQRAARGHQGRGILQDNFLQRWRAVTSQLLLPARQVFSPLGLALRPVDVKLVTTADLAINIPLVVLVGQWAPRNLFFNRRRQQKRWLLVLIRLVARVDCHLCSLWRSHQT